MHITWSKPSLLRDFTLLAVLIIGGLALMSLWVTYETYLDHYERVIHQLETEATRLDRAMILEIEHSSYLLEGLGREITLMDTHDLKNIALLLRSFDTAATQHHVFSWIDEKQNNVVSSNTGVHSQGVNVADRDFIQKSIVEPWKIQIGMPIQGRISAKWVLPVALGVADISGRYVGTILISMDISTITRHLHSAVKESGVSFLLYSKNFIPFVEVTESEPTVGAQATLTRLKTVDLQATPSGLLSGRGLFGGHPSYIYYEASENYPYIILIGMSKKSGVGAIYQLLLPRLLQIFLMGAFMLMLLWLVRARLIAPVEALTHAAAGIARGVVYTPPAGTITSEISLLAYQMKKLSDYFQEALRGAHEKAYKNLVLLKDKEEAEFSNTVKIQFLKAITAELRAPLTILLGCAERLRRLHAESAARPETHRLETHDTHDGEDVQHAAQLVQAVIDDVLVLCNAEDARPNALQAPVALGVLLHQCLRQVKERFEADTLEVALKLPASLPRLQVDEAYLKQILLTLLLHVAEKSEAGSHIVISAVLLEGREAGVLLTFASQPAHESLPGRGHHYPAASGLSIPLIQALAALLHARLTIDHPHGKPASWVLAFPPGCVVF